jgi:hypothetical protein
LHLTGILSQFGGPRHIIRNIYKHKPGGLDGLRGFSIVWVHVRVASFEKTAHTWYMGVSYLGITDTAPPVSQI